MAIAVEAYSVVGLKARIEEKYDGGIASLSKTVPNATELADNELWRCSFMAQADAERFLAQLQQMGLNCSQGPDSDFVLVAEFDLSVAPYCEWLQIARWEKGVIAWRAGTNPRTVMAREGWSPEKGSGLQFVSSIGDENLEFRRLDGNVAVYFDKRQGCEVYVGRTEADPDEVYQAASRVIFDHGIDPGDSKLTGEAESQVRQAIANLEKLVQKFPDAWRSHFCIGKGRLALGELDGAYDSLRRAYELETETESVPREFAGVCLELGKADEAVRVGEKAAALKPDNVETLSNLACAYLIAGRLDEAATTITAALKLKVTDSTSLLLQRMVNEVMAGSRLQPHRLADLMNGVAQTSPRSQPPKARKTIWSRLQFWKRRL